MTSLSMQEFKDFIKEYKVASVAIAFVMGGAVSDLSKSFVNNIFMPLLNPILPAGDWKTASWTMGSIDILYGTFLASLLQFLILAFVIFIVVKKVLQLEQK